MNERTRRETIEDVLNAYVDSATESSYTALTEWIQRYPEYEKELTDFTVSWSLRETLPRSADAKEVDEETLVLRGMSVVQSILNKEEQEGIGKRRSFSGILGEGKACGMSIQKLADATELSVVLVRKLDRRLIRFASIPAEAINNLAWAVARSFDEVADYLRGQPTLSASTQYKADKTPELSEPEDFFEAVRNDETLPEEWRERWLALAPPEI